MEDEITWESQWDKLIRVALNKIGTSDVETKSRFSDGLAGLPYTASQKTKELVEQLKCLMEKIGLL